METRSPRPAARGATLAAALLIGALTLVLPSRHFPTALFGASYFGNGNQKQPPKAVPLANATPTSELIELPRGCTHAIPSVLVTLLNSAFQSYQVREQKRMPYPPDPRHQRILYAPDPSGQSSTTGTSIVMFNQSTVEQRFVSAEIGGCWGDRKVSINLPNVVAAVGSVGKWSADGIGRAWEHLPSLRRHPAPPPPGAAGGAASAQNGASEQNVAPEQDVAAAVGALAWGSSSAQDTLASWLGRETAPAGPPPAAPPSAPLPRGWHVELTAEGALAAALKWR